MAEELVRKRYKNRSGNSGVDSYALGLSFIQVWFNDGKGYEYSEASPGRRQVETMKRLAEAGSGLATYISRQVQGNYARKL